MPSLSRLLADFTNSFTDAFTQTIEQISSLYVSNKEDSNELASQKASLNQALARRILATRLKKFADNMYESSKGDIQYLVSSLYPKVILVPGSELYEMHSDNLFQLFLTVRRGALKVDEAKLKANLILAGVDPLIIEKAFTDALVSAKPTTLFDIMPSQINP
jgi:hypothetical protein